MNAMSTQPSGIHGFTMKDIDGRERTLSEFKGKVVLIVNVASKCGYTPQYAGLQKLHDEYKDKGMVVLGVPSNDFGAQEPGAEPQIKEFCTRNYGVTFPMLAKVPVKYGPEQTPLYQYLTQKGRNSVLDAKVAWNSNKFLVGKDGQVLRHYGSKVKPEDAELRRDIDKALATN
jgi:glutathione peroxidase